jgi:hypothetical protein
MPGKCVSVESLEQLGKLKRLESLWFQYDSQLGLVLPLLPSSLTRLKVVMPRIILAGFTDCTIVMHTSPFVSALKQYTPNLTSLNIRRGFRLNGLDVGDGWPESMTSMSVKFTMTRFTSREPSSMAPIFPPGLKRLAVRHAYLNVTFPISLLPVSLERAKIVDLPLLYDAPLPPNLVSLEGNKMEEWVSRQYPLPESLVLIAPLYHHFDWAPIGVRFNAFCDCRVRSIGERQVQKFLQVEAYCRDVLAWNKSALVVAAYMANALKSTTTFTLPSMTVAKAQRHFARHAGSFLDDFVDCLRSVKEISGKSGIEYPGMVKRILSRCNYLEVLPLVGNDAFETFLVRHAESKVRLGKWTVTMPAYLRMLRLNCIAFTPKLARSMATCIGTTIERLHIKLVGGIASWRCFSSHSQQFHDAFPRLMALIIEADIADRLYTGNNDNDRGNGSAIVLRFEVSSIVSKYHWLDHFELHVTHGISDHARSAFEPDLMEHGDWAGTVPNVGFVDIRNRGELVHHHGGPLDW